MALGSWVAFALSFAFVLFEGALQLSGYTDPALAVAMVAGAVLSLLYIPYIMVWDRVQPPKLDHTIEFDWKIASTMLAAEDGRYHSITLLPTDEKSISGGPWTSNMPSSFGMGNTAYECRVYNHNVTPIFNVVFDLDCTFWESIEDDTHEVKTRRQADKILSRPWRVSIGKISPGSDHSFVFYLINLNDYYVNVRGPKTLMFQRLGGRKIETALFIPLSRNEVWLTPPLRGFAFNQAPRVEPDYEKWDQVQLFKLIELAYLWENEEPGGYAMPQHVRERFDHLASDAKERKLILDHGDDLKEVIRESMDQVNRGRSANPNWTAKREDAKAYAWDAGERPKFLFPMERV